MEQVLAFLDRHAIRRLDLTGGAPEMNPHFHHLVEQSRRMGVDVMDRCNLTIMEEPGQEGLAEFLAGQQVEVLASLPYYLEEHVDAQRGDGVFASSIRGLERLNHLGYGEPESGLCLNLVYNPRGLTLPPSQEMLEADYKKQLLERYGIRFNQLFTIINMPIQRFGSTLFSRGEFQGYMQRLREAFRSKNMQAVMCRSLLSVDWQGRLFDCDFNQMLDLSFFLEGVSHPHLCDLMEMDLSGRAVQVGEHCYGCTAGQGSSCGGALGG